MSRQPLRYCSGTVSQGKRCSARRPLERPMAISEILLPQFSCSSGLTFGRRPPEVPRRGPGHCMLSSKTPQMSPSAASDRHEGLVRVIDTDYKQRIKEFWQGRAEVYDVNNTFHPPLCTHLVRVAELPSGANVLDVATGTGHVAFAAANAVGPTGHVLGIDITESMLQQVRQKHTNQPSSTHYCRLIVCTDSVC